METHLTKTSFHVVVKSSEVSPQSPFLKTKHPQFLHLLLTVHATFSMFLYHTWSQTDDSLTKHLKVL